MSSNLAIAEKHPADTPYTNIPTQKKHVALTFDDGPDPYVLPKLLDLLKKEDVKATFFLIGENVLKYPELAKRIRDEGHEIGNHSMTHAKLSECDTMAGVKKEILETQSAIKETLGVTPVTFRAPFLDHDTRVWAVLNELKMPSINANVYTQDYDESITAKQILASVTRQVSAGDVVLCHSWPANTLEAMPDIIAHYKKHRLEMVTISTMLASERDK
jgi:peptidoglycan/xylan/chitin deacetylase (PgdA/CDA1 family)